MIANKQLVTYGNSEPDYIDESATLHSFNIHTLINANEYSFSDYLLASANSDWTGNGEFEISHHEDRVIAINYITTDDVEISNSFIQLVASFIEAKVREYLSINKQSHFH